MGDFLICHSCSLYRAYGLDAVGYGPCEPIIAVHKMHSIDPAYFCYP